MHLEISEALLTEVFYHVYALPVHQLHEEQGFEMDDKDGYLATELRKHAGQELVMVVHRLELPHFLFLSRLLSISLEDLSFYIFPFLLGCKGEVPLTIMEYEFVKGTLKLLGSATPARSSTSFQPPSCTALGTSTGSSAAIGGMHFHETQERFHPIWSALHDCIENCRLEIYANAEKAREFYNFLYTFVLHRNNSPECIRRQLAVELWKMFFRSSEASIAHGAVQGVSQLEEKTFLSKETECGRLPCTLNLATFERLPEWIAFITSSSIHSFPKEEEEEEEEEKEEEQYGVDRMISLDMWQQLWNFAKLTSYDTYDFSSPWPNVMDDFVMYMRSTQASSSMPRLPYSPLPLPSSLQE